MCVFMQAVTHNIPNKTLQFYSENEVIAELLFAKLFLTFPL